jgi:hypothetical protein
MREQVVACSMYQYQLINQSHVIPMWLGLVMTTPNTMSTQPHVTKHAQMWEEWESMPGSVYFFHPLPLPWVRHLSPESSNFASVFSTQVRSIRHEPSQVRQPVNQSRHFIPAGYV